jgi:hypothetical protein
MGFERRLSKLLLLACIAEKLVPASKGIFIPIRLFERDLLLVGSRHPFIWQTLEHEGRLRLLLDVILHIWHFLVRSGALKNTVLSRGGLRVERGLLAGLLVVILLCICLLALLNWCTQFAGLRLTRLGLSLRHLLLGSVALLFG